MAIVLLGILFAVASAGCSLIILIHAFRRSIGTGVMVLLIPFFIFFYAFSQFEHRKKGLLLALWLFATGLAAAFGAWLSSPALHAARVGLPDELVHLQLEPHRQPVLDYPLGQRLG